MEELEATFANDQLSELLEEKRYEELNEQLHKMPIIEVAEFLIELPEEERLKIFSSFSLEMQGLIASDFDMETIEEIFETMEIKNFATVFEQMRSDIRADFYQTLDKEEQAEILPFLNKKTREDVIHLSSYPPETAGGIMTTDFATIIAGMTVQQAIEKVRRDAPSKKMVYYIYVVDEGMVMKGFLTLKDLVMADPEVLVKDITHSEFINALVSEDRESVAVKIEKYDLVAIPVLNKNNQLVGIVSHDDAIDVIRAEHTEDMEKFMGIVPHNQDLEYLDTTSWQHFRKRVYWVVFLAAVGIISGVIIHRFENALEQLIVLALYMPMMADTGGNAGSQAATVVIRAMALGQVTTRDWFKIFFKESKIGLMLAICLGVLAFGKVLFLSWETNIPDQFSLLNIAFIISLSLAMQVVSSTLIGSALPILVKRFGGDPAVAASPAISTVVDITGLLIYFGMATTFLLS